MAIAGAKGAHEIVFNLVLFARALADGLDFHHQLILQTHWRHDNGLGLVQALVQSHFQLKVHRSTQRDVETLRTAIRTLGLDLGGAGGAGVGLDLDGGGYGFVLLPDEGDNVGRVLRYHSGQRSLSAIKCHTSYMLTCLITLTSTMDATLEYKSN